MKVIAAVQLHPTGRYPLAAEWIDIGEGLGAWNLAAPRERVSALDVFAALEGGARVSTVFPDGAHGFLAGQDVEPVKHSGVATFKLGPPELHGRSLQDLEQLS